MSCGRVLSIIYSDYVFVALGIQQAMSLHHIVVCGLPGCTLFFPHYLIKGKIFQKKKVTENKIF
jgi:hypothetical protein